MYRDNRFLVIPIEFVNEEQFLIYKKRDFVDLKDWINSIYDPWQVCGPIALAVDFDKELIWIPHRAPDVSHFPHLSQKLPLIENLSIQKKNDLFHGSQC